MNAKSSRGRHRHLLVLAIDELPIFKSSAELLATVALPQCRKHLVRTLACACGASAFAQGQEDRLLQSFLSLAGTRLFFRHNSELDCSLFGRHIALPAYSPTIEKYRHEQPMQFQVGLRVAELTDTSITDSQSDSEGQSQGATTTETQSSNNATTTTLNESESIVRDRQLLRQAVIEARSEARGQQTGRGQSSGSSVENTVNHSHTTSRSRGISRKQQLVPIIKTLPVCTSVNFFQKEELDAMGAARIANQRVGQAILHQSGLTPVQVTFPYPNDPFAMSPKFGRKKEAEHQAVQERRTGFATVEQIEQQRRLLLESLVRRLTAVANQRTDPLLTAAGEAAMTNALPNERHYRTVLAPTNDPESTPLEI